MDRSYTPVSHLPLLHLHADTSHSDRSTIASHLSSYHLSNEDLYQLTSNENLDHLAWLANHCTRHLMRLERRKGKFPGEDVGGEYVDEYRRVLGRCVADSERGERALDLFQRVAAGVADGKHSLPRAYLRQFGYHTCTVDVSRQFASAGYPTSIAGYDPPPSLNDDCAHIHGGDTFDSLTDSQHGRAHLIEEYEIQGQGYPGEPARPRSRGHRRRSGSRRRHHADT